MGYSGETNDINFSRRTTAFYGFLGFLINGESTNGDGLSESNVQMPFSTSTVTLRKNSTRITQYQLEPFPRYYSSQW